ncbi:hypothetical protein AVEN_253498-1 [Araneus ventricosus]|uniref:Uncharacterized protein n=1 Tax=Araneus ventricosus TaxID=182803 RepID=A0A4Y2BUK8_ARAVE|nr:hypothetical protein AVEN_253498-1 [Araneus ventricosus]
MIRFSAIHLGPKGIYCLWNSTRRPVSTVHAQSTTARRNCTEASVHRLAFFDVREFTDICPERSSHPTSPRAIMILCGSTTGDKVHFKQGTPKHGPWERLFMSKGVYSGTPGWVGRRHFSRC